MLNISAIGTAIQILFIQNNIGKNQIQTVVKRRLLMNETSAEAFQFSTLVKNDEVYIFIHANRKHVKNQILHFTAIL